MKDYLEARRKALAPVLAGLAGAAVLWAASGEVNTEELSVLVAGLVSALLVERVPNKER